MGTIVFERFIVSVWLGVAVYNYSQNKRYKLRHAKIIHQSLDSVSSWIGAFSRVGSLGSIALTSSFSKMRKIMIVRQSKISFKGNLAIIIITSQTAGRQNLHHSRV